MTRYYETPFADIGDRSDIPNAVQPSGSVSYTQGYGSDYELDLATDPSAKAFPRDQNNQFCYDVTENIQQFQQYGVPLFIPSMTNAPGTYSYDAGVIVRYDDGLGFKFYQSIVSGNTALPTDSTKWRKLDAAQDILVYYTDNFGASVVTGDIVAFSSVTFQFEKAVAGNAILQDAIGIANIEENYIQIAGVYSGYSGLTPGAEYYLSSSTAGGLSLTTTLGITIVIVGYAVSTNELVLRIQREIGSDNIVNYGVVSFNAATTQSIAGGSHPVQFDAVTHDPLNWWDEVGFRWLPTTSGLYRFSACVFGSAPNSSQGLNIYKNGAFLYRLGLLGQETSTSNGAPSGTSPPVHLNGSTDSVQLIWENESASATTIGAKSGSGGDKNFFCIEYLGQ